MRNRQNKILLGHLSEDILFAYTSKVELDDLLRGEIESQEYIFNNPIELASHLRKLLEVVDAHLKWEYHSEIKKLNASFDETNYRRLKQRISEATRVIAALTPLVKYIDGSKVQKNNWGLVTYIDRFCRQLYPKARVIIRPRWEYNYTYISITQELNKIANQAQFSDSSLQFALREQIEDSFHFLSLAYPPIAAQNILQLAIWSHEIAHFVDSLEGYSYATQIAGDVSINHHSESFSIMLVRKHLEETEFQIDNRDYKKLLALSGISEDDPDFVDRYTSEITEPLADMITYWAREIFADLLSIRLMGPAVLFPFLDFVYPVSLGLDTINDLWYPPLRVRLKIMLAAYDMWSDKNANWMDSLPKHIKNGFDDEITYMKGLIKSPREEVVFLNKIPSDNQGFYKIFYKILEKMTDAFVNTLLPKIDYIVAKNSSLFITPSDLSLFLKDAIEDLENKLPPNVTSFEDGKLFALLLNAGWLVWLDKRKNNKSKKLDKYDYGIEDFNNINLLLIKAIENLESNRWFNDRKSYGELNLKDGIRKKTSLDGLNHQIDNSPGSGVLSREEIKTYIQKKKIRIVPFLDEETQIGSCSLDIRLGNEFIIARTSLLSKIDPADFDLNVDRIQLQSKIYIPFGKPFVLHPGQFVLGSTLEYFKLPNDIMGLLIGRSSWGRLGLAIATPNKINPGFAGSLTLQISNLGNIPIQLYPCARLGQIIFYKIRGAT